MLCQESGEFMGFFDKLKGKLKGKSPGGRKKGTEKKSLEDRYGVSESSFQENPLYEADAAGSHYGEWQTNPLFSDSKEEDSEGQTQINAGRQGTEPAAPSENLLTNIGGMPDIRSIESMAGGLKLDKISRHPSFHKALESLKAYQAIMGAPRSTTVNEAAMTSRVKYTAEVGEVKIDKEAIAEARSEISNFIYYAGKAIEESSGRLASRSSNVQKLTPIFANLLVKTGGILPKLTYLESAVPSYIIQTGNYQYTFSDVIGHEVMGGHSGGLAMSGLEDDNGEVALSPEQVQSIAGTIRTTGNMDELVRFRHEGMEKRMKLQIPVLPVGALSEVKTEAFGGQKVQELDKAAEKIADRYIAELRPLMTALDDVAESQEFTGDIEEERRGVQGQKAKEFRTSRLLYRVMSNKEALKTLIIKGFPEQDQPKPQGYDDMLQLYELRGRTLSNAVEELNAKAMDESHYASLTDSEGNDLVNHTDYVVGGGMTSISILDFKNRRVLRAPKTDTGEYTSKQEQQTALNGIRDEAAGKVAQFLGFNVCAQAEAAGFKARDKEGQNETAVFGGSIMQMASGKTGGNINVLLNSGDEKEKIAKYRRDEGRDNQNVNLFENGRMVEDIMKMNALDFLIQHNDRNLGNFLVNVNAGSNESMVTAIDNDMILGFDNHVKIGGDRSQDALLAINERARMDFGITLKAALPMMTQDMKDKLAALDTEAFNQLLMPYADRLTRMTAVHRAKELKEWAKKVPTCDLTKPEGIKEYYDVAKKAATEQWLSLISLDNVYSSVRYIPNTLIHMIVSTYCQSSAELLKPADIMKRIKALGFTKEEVESFIMENCSVSSNSYKKATKEDVENSPFGKLLASYDELQVNAS